MRVTLTQGAIDNGYIAFPLSESVFPEESYGDRSGEKKGVAVLITDELGKEYRDDIRAVGNSARPRSRFGAFFKAVQAKAGDYTELEMLSPGNYLLRVVPNGQPLPPNKPIVEIPQSVPEVTIAEETSVLPKNVILYGPPGTGKTYSVVLKAMSIVDGVDYGLSVPPGQYQNLKQRYDALARDGQIYFVTFHQSYGYEDFIEGIRPHTEDGQITYEVRNGILKNIAMAARENWQKSNAEAANIQPMPPELETLKPYILIIDEINRGNISKIFGELITLVEEDKRLGEPFEMTVTLPYTQGDEEPFGLPPNLYLVGTMNTSDRSIALLDTALRRRFEFEELQPDPNVLNDIRLDVDVNLTKLLSAINARIEYLYDRDHTIGHAYFIGVKSLADLDRVFRRKVIPLLQEYFYEDWSKVVMVLNDSAGNFIKRDNSIPSGMQTADIDFEPRPRFKVNDSPFQLEAFQNLYRG